MGWADVVDTLLASGAPLEEKGREGLTPLILALKGGLQEVALALIKAGADKSIKDKVHVSLRLHSTCMSMPMRMKTFYYAGTIHYPKYCPLID